MIKDKVVLRILCVGLPVSALFYILAYFLNQGTVFFIVLGFAVFLITVIVAQTLYTWRKFMDEEKSRLATMKPCEHCDKPIYQDDEVCPYCHEPQTPTKDTQN